MKTILLAFVSVALLGCQAEVSAPIVEGMSHEILAERNAYFDSLPAAPTGYRLQTVDDVIPEIVMRGIPEGAPGWSFLIKDNCYYYRFNEGATEEIYPAPDTLGVSWNDPNARPYCANG